MATIEQLDLVLGWGNNNEQGLIVREVSDKAYSWTRDKDEGFVVIRFSNLYITYYGRQYAKQLTA